jgi:hypothetical protein
MLPRNCFPIEWFGRASGALGLATRNDAVSASSRPPDEEIERDGGFDKGKSERGQKPAQLFDEAAYLLDLLSSSARKGNADTAGNVPCLPLVTPCLQR